MGVCDFLTCFIAHPFFLELAKVFELALGAEILLVILLPVYLNGTLIDGEGCVLL